MNKNIFTDIDISMSYSDTIDYLFGLQKHGIKLGLDNTVKLLSCFGNPQTSFKSVHVAGTNGKGSTSAMIASILQSAGFKVGLFTSPHLVSFTERIRINNKQITENEVVELADEIKLKVESLKLEVKNSKSGTFEPTFFEVVTAMGFIYFKRKNVDWAVIETGMGGRLDATNVLMPEATVITSIGYDHKEFLGNTISDIAGEKAGIIKEHVPVITSSQEPVVMDKIEKKAREKDSEIFVYGRDFAAKVKHGDINGSVFDYQGDIFFEDIKVSLPGAHQVLNASLALKTSTALIKRSELLKARLTPDAVRDGLKNVKWPGRLELVSDNPPILIDGAHNPSASASLADSLRRIFLKTYKRIILIAGMMADKDIKGIMAPLLPMASEIILTAPGYERAASAEILAECAASLGFTNVHIASTVKSAIDTAIKIRQKSEVVTRHSSLILITGSFYTIGEAKEALGEKGILSRLRE